MLDREVSSDTEPDAEVVQRYAVRKGIGPEIEVEWAIPVLQCSESEETTRELPTYPHLEEREYGTIHTTMGHKVNLHLTHAYAGSLREMTANSALHVILQHDVGPKCKYARCDSTLHGTDCLLYTSPSPRDATLSRMPSSA